VIRRKGFSLHRYCIFTLFCPKCGYSVECEEIDSGPKRFPDISNPPPPPPAPDKYEFYMPERKVPSKEELASMSDESLIAFMETTKRECYDRMREMSDWECGWYSGYKSALEQYIRILKSRVKQ